MAGDHSKATRENKTIEFMVKIYCNGQHRRKAANLCSECNQLLKYAGQRIKNCIHKENKTTCAKRTVHCYKPSMRENIKKVMRYASPRMIYKHPVLAMLHLLDGLKTKSPRVNCLRYTSQLSKKVIPASINTDKVVNLNEVALLPPPVKNFFHYTLKNGRPIINRVYIEQIGGFRAKPEMAKWSKMKAVQYFSTTPRAFVWDAKISIFPMLTIMYATRILLVKEK